MSTEKAVPDIPQDGWHTDEYWAYCLSYSNAESFRNYCKSHGIPVEKVGHRTLVHAEDYLHALNQRLEERRKKRSLRHGKKTRE